MQTRLTMTAISKGSLAQCLFRLDVGSTNGLAPQNHQIAEQTYVRTLSSWLFYARLSVRDKLTSRRPDAILVTHYLLHSNCLPLPICPRCLTQDNQMERCAELTSSILAIGKHLVEVKYCEDARPGHHLLLQQTKWDSLQTLMLKSHLPHHLSWHGRSNLNL